MTPPGDVGAAEVAWVDAADPALARAPDGPPGTARIVGGAEAPPGSWPDAVAIFTVAGFGCMGTLIGPRQVLTAGHCQYGLDHVRVGGHTLEDGVRVGIAGVVAHPDHYLTLDLALLTLDADVPGIAPRALAAGCAAGLVADGVPATIVGFGATDPFGVEFPDTLQQGETIIAVAACDAARGCQPGGGELVAGGDGVDSCGGDSGGPLYVDGGDGAFLLAGITSRAAEPVSRPCGDGGIYVRADAAAEWLATLGVETARPDTCPNLPPRASADPVVAAPGGLALVPLTLSDPDGEVVAVSARAERGAVLSAGATAVAYRAPVGTGGDTLVVTVTDDGGAVAVLDVPITLRSVGVPSGCDTGAVGVGGGAVALAAALGRQRRRRAPALKAPEGPT